jgi:hypothetical protein
MLTGGNRVLRAKGAEFGWPARSVAGAVALGVDTPGLTVCPESDRSAVTANSTIQAGWRRRIRRKAPIPPVSSGITAVPADRAQPCRLHQHRPLDSNEYNDFSAAGRIASGVRDPPKRPISNRCVKSHCRDKPRQRSGMPACPLICGHSSAPNCINWLAGRGLRAVSCGENPRCLGSEASPCSSLSPPLYVVR